MTESLSPTQMFEVFAPGTMLGRYELLAQIGEGGMARVMLARQRGPAGFEKVVVIKMIHPRMAEDQAAIGMLLDEARIAAQINHPHVVQTFELGESGGNFYIVMEYLAGESFQRILKQATLGPSLDPRMAARIVADAADGLHAAHELCDLGGKKLGLVHRDVSLGNIVVLYNGNTKVVDFGIAKSRDRVASTTQQGQLKGKYAYMSPEQIRDEPLDRRSDVFSLGVVLWEALTLRRLFDGSNVPATLMQILSSDRVAPSQHRPDVPRALDEIALRALAPDPARRFQSALEMKHALEDAIWDSRCTAGDVGMYMQAVFADRIQRRQLLLASATTRPAMEIEPRDAMFDATSGIRTPAPAPRGSQQPIAKELYRPPMPEPTPRRRWAGVALLLLGVAVGGGTAALLANDQHPPTQVATTEPAQPAPQPRETTTEPARPEPVVTETAAPAPAPAPIEVTPVADVPTFRSRLRPEHLEPIRVEPGSTQIIAARPERPVERPDRPDRPDRPETPQGPSAKELTARGTELYLAGKFVDAQAAFKQALAADRGFALAHRGLGLVYQRMGFSSKAIDSFRKYLAMAPRATDAASVKQRIEELGGEP